MLIKEIRTRMRGNRAFLLVSSHLLFQFILVSILFLLFRVSYSQTSSIENQFIFSKVVFGFLIFLELIVISFIAPVLTAGSFSLERERRTYDLVRVTLLTAKELVMGKLSSALTFILLLLVTSIPMLSPAFIIRSVSGKEIVISFLLLVITAVTFSTIGMTISCLVKRTLLANILSFAITIFFIFGIPVLILTALVIVQTGNTLRIEAMNPIAQVIWLVMGWILVSISPLTTIIATEYILLQQNSVWLVEIPINDVSTLPLVSPWIIHVLFYSVFVFLLIKLSIRRVEFPEQQ